MKVTTSSPAEFAHCYAQAGLCVLPADRTAKRPTLSGFKHFRTQPPKSQQLQHWFSASESMCILTGAASGNLEVIDFDHKGVAFDPWSQIIQAEASYLYDRLVIAKTQSGGRHVIYRCESEVSGSTVLARSWIEVPDGCPVVMEDKQMLPKEFGGRYFVSPLLIETRGEGGLFLCDPTPGYEIIQGSLTRLPILSDDEHELLLGAAKSLDETPVETSGSERALGAFCGDLGGSLPGDAYNQSGDVRGVLERHGWRRVKGGENEQWCRPGKRVGCSATLKNRVFYVFSSNATPFEPGRGYGPFAVYALLEHGGDFAAACHALSSEGYGESDSVDLSSFSVTTDEPDGGDEDERRNHDPGPLPDRLYHVPGFISEVMDHCLDTAPYPNQVMAFCGALALQATLAGRRVRDPGDNRTNLYLLGLAHSAAGKDWPRKLNVKILQEIGMADCTGERFASGEGIQDSLLITPSMLFQTDEIDGLLQSINKSRDARHEQIMSTLLTMYSSANSVFPMRRKAGTEPAGVINQPSLVIFGTAIPNHYYEALSERMLTNGLFARMLIFECGKRGRGQEPKICDLPDSIIETAKWWQKFQPGPAGNLGDWNPTPAIVPHDSDARRLLVDSRINAEEQYEKAEQANDSVGTTVWGRVSEQTRKLALLHAVSRQCKDPLIDAQSARWAIEVVEHQTRRMLFMAGDHVSSNDFDAMAKSVVRQLKKWRSKRGDEPMPEWELTRRLPWKPSDHKEVIKLLDTQRLVARVPSPSKTRPGFVYQLLEN